ncbi:GntR family transcriptional regulator [Streptomyces sp. NRRL F-5135]|uniref:GntR family transcriptional regulator n=1 Tax=Streptomyces sp. NRRL F-5135 TaxID=1463858 RepID=UPI0004CBFFC2|nr:GntR family transcriptional regulator [Streptomyces sp. NRRL F-5135]
MEQRGAPGAAGGGPYATGPSGTPAPGAGRVPGQPGPASSAEAAARWPTGVAARPAERTREAPDGPARPVRRHTVRGQILDALRAALVSGELAPGEVYSAPALGERFGVSATPVREAMHQLTLEGAVEVVPNRGFRVTERGARDRAELAEIRALIEVPVLLRLARTVPPERFAELRPLADAAGAAAACGDRTGYAERDRAFHRALLTLAGNRQLVLVADEMHRRSQWPSPGSTAARRAALRADAAEHTALLDALTAGDRATAEALIRQHFADADGGRNTFM